VVAADWPQQRYGLGLSDGPRFEMYVYVSDVDQLVTQLRAEAVSVLKILPTCRGANAWLRSPTRTVIRSPSATSRP